MSRVTGIIHVGAHDAEELQDYLLSGINKVIWIEANPDKAAQLVTRLAKFKLMKVGSFAAGNVAKDMMLNIANNGQSSSLLEFGTHTSEHPHVTFVRQEKVSVSRIDDFIADQGLCRSDFNFFNLDIQGYELNALKGSIKQLPYVDYIYTEINERELYRDCCLVSELDEFLECYGFLRVKTAMTQHGWGDAFYFKAFPL